MSAAFTPGPWYASEPFAGFGAIKQAETDALIFGLAAGDPDEKQADETCEANASLIAAAPDLYRQLEIFVSTVVNDDLLALDPALAREAGATIALLAKARGEPSA